MLQILERKKIDKKIHAYRENTLLKASRQLYTPKEIQNKVIIKYAPKYSRSLTLESWKNPQLINAMKRLKKVKEVNQKLIHRRHKNQWRLVLQNKFKSIQVFIHDQDRNKIQVIQKYKAFPNLKSLLLDLTYEGTYDRRLKKKERALAKYILRYLPSMRNLKNFEVEIYRRTNPSLLQKLNKMSNLLSSLKSFQVHCGDDSTLKLLPTLVNCKNLLKYTTHLSMIAAADVEPEEIFESLFKNCENLLSLSINLSYESDAKTDIPVHCLKIIKNLDKLEAIRISFEDIFGFLENFTAPPSLKSIILNSKSGSWKEAYQKFFSMDLNTLSEDEIFDLFEKDKRLAKFSEKWGNMKNLVSLSLLAHQDLEKVSAIPIFMKTLLKNMENLETLDLQIDVYFHDEYLPDYYDYYYFAIKIDLNHVLQDTCKRLKTLKLRFSKDHCISCSRIPRDFIFPQLTEIDISESQVENFGETMRNLLGAVKRQPEKSIKLSTWETINIESKFVNALKVLQKPPRNCAIDMKIVDYGNLRSFYEDMNQFIEKARNDLSVKNVIIKVLADNLQRLKKYRFLGEIFENVKFQNREAERIEAIERESRSSSPSHSSSPSYSSSPSRSFSSDDSPCFGEAQLEETQDS